MGPMLFTGYRAREGAVFWYTKSHTYEALSHLLPSFSSGYSWTLRARLSSSDSINVGSFAPLLFTECETLYLSQ